MSLYLPLVSSFIFHPFHVSVFASSFIISSPSFIIHMYSYMLWNNWYIDCTVMCNILWTQIQLWIQWAPGKNCRNMKLVIHFNIMKLTGSV
jgi:hypothetical protein